MSVTSAYYPGEIGTVVRAQPDGWWVISWPSEPACRCWMKSYAVTVVN